MPDLHPQIQRVLQVMAEANLKPIEAMTPTEARAQMEATAQSRKAEPLPVARVEEQMIPGPAGHIRLRLYWPNAVGPAIVGATFAVAWVVLVEASVDFLRGGPPDAAASWGQLMGQARTHDHAWWLVVFPGAALLATLIALTLVGEAARNALDPRLRDGTGSV